MSIQYSWWRKERIMDETSKRGLICIFAVLAICLAISLYAFNQPATPVAVVQENTTVKEVVNVPEDKSSGPAPSPTMRPEIMFSDLIPQFSASGSLTEQEIRDGLRIYNLSIYKAEIKENDTETTLLAYIPDKKNRVTIGNGVFEQIVYLGDDGKAHRAENVTVREGVKAPVCYKLILEDKSSKATTDKFYFYLFGDKGRTAVGLTHTKLSPPSSARGSTVTADDLRDGEGSGSAEASSSSSDSNSGGDDDGPVRENSA